MKWVAQTLWDLFKVEPPAPAPAAPPPRPKTRPGDRRRAGIHERYGSLVAEMKSTYDIRVRKWRTSSSGCAWEVHDRRGAITRLIEAPYPRGPMSCAIFLHEVGHHAIGFGRYRPRCLEEYHAWRWSLEAMEAHGFNVTDAVRRRMRDSLCYAVDKARRRGLKRVPVELLPYLDGASARGAIGEGGVQQAG